MAEHKDHSIAGGVGAAGGAVTGLAAGAALGGPVGAAVGAAVGALAGGAAGQGLAEAFDPAVEDAYWRDNYTSRPYVRPGSSYDDYGDAYLYGGRSRAHSKTSWDESEADLERGWRSARKTSSLNWPDARHAVRDGWHRIERALPGDADHDGR